MGKRRFTRLITATLTAVALSGAASAECSDETLSMRGEFGSVQFSVDVADSEAERSRGLMFVEEMATMQGMLFVYDGPSTVSFWMRNTLIPLDMVFVDETGVVRNIHSMAQPLDETPIFGGTDIQYVLEINGGMAERLGLQAGDEMQHASFSDDAVWPCEIN